MYEQYSDKFKDIYDAVPVGKAFRLAFDSGLNQMRILSRDRSNVDEIVEAFSTANSSAFFTKQFGYAAQEKLYSINKFGYFSPGLVFDVLNWIKIHYGDLSFVAISKNCLNYINDILQPLKHILKDNKFEIVNLADENGRNNERKTQGLQEYVFRDYQKKSIEQLIFSGYGRGLIEVPTGGGKSFIISNFIWNLHKFVDNSLKVMIFVPNTQLVEQFYKDLIDYGYRKENLAKFCGALKAKERKQQDLANAKIIIANRQYVFKNKNLLPNIDVMVCDEVHSCTADSTLEYITRSTAKLKIGCSGTLPVDKYNYWKLIGAFGKVVYKEDVNDLQNRGFISKLKITLLDILDKKVENNRNYLFHLNANVKYHPDEFGNAEILFNDAYYSELDFYQKEYARIYEPVLKYLNSLDENILVLFDRIETGKGLFDITKELVLNKTAYYIDGSTEITLREDVRQQFEQNGNNILIGNVSILGTGINIKRLNHIVFLCNTKSNSRVIQSIGRTLRLHSSKQEAHLIDVCYNYKYSLKHYRERMQIYRNIYKKQQPDEVIRLEIN